MVRLTQSLARWLMENHIDKLPLIMFGHTELLTEEMCREYLEWCLTDEGKQYLRGGSKYRREYIDRDAVIDLVESLIKFTNAAYKESENAEKYAALGAAEGILYDVRELPAADVVEVVHAKWNNDGRCTNCGGHAPFYSMASTYHESPYCFECGAKMDTEE